MTQEQIKEYLESIWNDKVTREDRLLDIWRYCKTHGSINDNFLSLCDDPECGSYKIAKQEVT